MMKFVVYNFKTEKDNTRYYTDKRIPYQEWTNMLTKIQADNTINMITIYNHFVNTIKKCNIEQIHPICDEYYTFGSEKQ